jgi:hypothetical protein
MAHGAHLDKIQPKTQSQYPCNIVLFTGGGRLSFAGGEQPGGGG